MALSANQIIALGRWPIRMPVKTPFWKPLLDVNIYPGNDILDGTKFNQVWSLESGARDELLIYAYFNCK